MNQSFPRLQVPSIGTRLRNEVAMVWRLRLATQQVAYYTFACLYLVLLLYPKVGATVPLSRNERRVRESANESSTAPSESAAKLLRHQLINPAEVLSVLLIIGGDIVQKACAQLSAGQKGIPITPVAFSFGWVAYAFGALMSAFGDGSMMPAPDISSFVAVVGGQRKINESWVIGRFIRDQELYNKRQDKDKTPKLGGLSVKFYQTDGESSKPHCDIIWWSFAFFMPCQFGVAAAPIYHGNWSILMITGFGTALALLMGSLPQWKREKYSGRPKGFGTYVLTRGNGHSHVFVIRVSGDDKFITLDDLATSRNIPHRTERAYIVILAILWVLLLMIVGGTEQDTWFLLGVGVIGMAHNVVVAGFKRHPKAHGLPVKNDEDMQNCTIDEDTVFPAIQLAETKCPGVGLSLIPFFFPDGLRQDQETWRVDCRSTFESRHAEMEAEKVAARKRGS